MKLTILIGGKAGQGINKVTEIMSNVLGKLGYFTFNYRDYPSLIRGGHNFNSLSVSDSQIESHESTIEILVAFDDKTVFNHKKELVKSGITITAGKFESEGQNMNIALAGCLTKILGLPFEELENEVRNQIENPDDAINSARKGFDSQKEKYKLERLNNKISRLSGSKAVSIGAINSGLQLYTAYPMTPATGVLNELATEQQKNNLMVFQAENEIAACSMALGASYTGKKTMTGTSGGGFDLMSESLSLQGISEIPLTVYLASRAGPGTGVPTYSAQSDLDIALRSGHGEFPRFVIAPGTPIEAIEKTSEALFLAEKYKSLSILLSDKHLAESEFSTTQEPKSTPKFDIKRKVPGEYIVKASSYEVDKFGNTTEMADLTVKNVDRRIKKYEDAKKYIEENFEMIKIHGKKDSKNLIIGWGSSSGAIKDAIKDLNVKFLQVIYCKPLSPKIKSEMKKAKKVILIEANVTGQLGRLIREKTGLKVDKKILRYDARPFTSNELKEQIKKLI